MNILKYDWKNRSKCVRIHINLNPALQIARSRCSSNNVAWFHCSWMAKYLKRKINTEQNIETAKSEPMNVKSVQSIDVSVSIYRSLNPNAFQKWQTSSFLFIFNIFSFDWFVWCVSTSHLLHAYVFATDFRLLTSKKETHWCGVVHGGRFQFFVHLKWLLKRLKLSFETVLLRGLFLFFNYLKTFFFHPMLQAANKTAKN